VCRGLAGQPGLLVQESLPGRLRSMQTSLAALSSAASAASAQHGALDSLQTTLTVLSPPLPLPVAGSRVFAPSQCLAVHLQQECACNLLLQAWHEH
jgi:hypothetical protein